MDERRFELDLASRRVLFRLKVFKKEGEAQYSKKCDALQEDLKLTLGEEIKIKNYPFMADSVLFTISVPFEREDSVCRTIMDLAQKYFPF